MISDQILQNTIDGLKAITRIDCVLWIQTGKHWRAHFQSRIIMKMQYFLLWKSPADPGNTGVSVFKRFLTGISWNIYCLQMAAVRMCTWLGKLRPSRSRIFW